MPGEHDGAVLKDMLRIGLPLGLNHSVFSLGHMAMQTFVGTWNDFYGPLIYINSANKMTLPLGLTQLRGVMGTGNQASIIAGVVLTFIPPLFMYIFGQRYLVEGITIGGIK